MDTSHQKSSTGPTARPSASGRRSSDETPPSRSDRKSPRARRTATRSVNRQAMVLRRDLGFKSGRGDDRCLRRHRSVSAGARVRSPPARLPHQKKRRRRQPLTKEKPTVCVDFDGVIKAHRGLTRGACQAIQHLRASYRVVILSSRAIEPVGKAEIAAWLEARNVSIDEITAEKIDAIAYIDDKAIRFRGNWAEVLGKLETSRPWWQGPKQ